MEDRLRKSLETMAFWNTLLGYFMLIGGIISAISGLVPLVFPAILGGLSAYLGYCLLQSGKQAKRLLQESNNEEGLLIMVESLARYFKLQGIYMFISLVFVFLVVGLVIVFGIGMGDTGTFTFAP